MSPTTADQLTQHWLPLCPKQTTRGELAMTVPPLELRWVRSWSQMVDVALWPLPQATSLLPEQGTRARLVSAFAVGASLQYVRLYSPTGMTWEIMRESGAALVGVAPTSPEVRVKTTVMRSRLGKCMVNGLHRDISRFSAICDDTYL
jgi:hypothetical protein